jgi:imidazolonepropionase-like amidohydrolase
MKMLIKLLSIFILFLACPTLLKAQEIPAPGPPQEIPIILRNAQIHPGNGSRPFQADLLIMEGKIRKIGEVRETFKRSEEFDLKGKSIYPGLIALNTHLGLSEIEAARPTIDTREQGENNAGLRALIAYNTDSRVTGTVRSNGILLAQTLTQSGVIRGISALVQLDAWNWEDAAYGGGDNALCIQWNGYPDKIRQLEAFFAQAQARMNSKGVLEPDVNLDALKPYLNRQKKVFIQAHRATEILQAIAFGEKFNLDLVLTGAYEAWKVKSEIAARNIPVVLSDIHRLPGQDEEFPDQPFRNPALLKEAGVEVSLCVEGFWQVRNLPFMAGTAAAYGLSREEALQMITLNPAKTLGVQNQTGSIEEGKDANLLITSGDILDMKSSIVEKALIQGRWVNLDNKQKQLYEKYKVKAE